MILYETAFVWGDFMETKNNKLLEVNNIDIKNGIFSIPDNIETIEAKAFFYCIKLREITFLNKITSIGNAAFGHCSNLKKINMPNEIKTIGKRAFSECFSLEAINIPNETTIIERETFEECENLKNIILSNSISKVGSYAFYGCKKLNKITVSKNTTYIDLNVICKAIKNQTNNNINIVAETSLFNVLDSISHSNLRKGLISFEYKVNTLVINNKEIDLKKLRKSFKTEKIENNKITYNTYIDEIRKEELLEKIKQNLKISNTNIKINFDYSEHKEFIEKIIFDLNLNNNYNYLNDFNQYINSYIEKLNISNISNAVKNSNTFELKNNTNISELKNYIKNCKFSKTDTDEYVNIINFNNSLNTGFKYISTYFYNTIIEFNKNIKVYQIKQKFNELVCYKNEFISKNNLSNSNNDFFKNLLTILTNLNNLINDELIGYEKENKSLNELGELIHLYVKNIKEFIIYLNTNQTNNINLNLLQKNEIIKDIDNIIDLIQKKQNEINLTINNNLLFIKNLNDMSKNLLPSLITKINSDNIENVDEFIEISNIFNNMINNQEKIISELERNNSFNINEEKNKQFYKKL